MDINHMVPSPEMVGEQTMGTYLGFWGVARDSFHSLNMKDECELIT